ncbi:MAG: HNH endonuclease, partial [Paraclostridium sp.]
RLKTVINQKGHECAKLHHQGKCKLYRVHRLVMLVYNPHELHKHLLVHHIDGNTLNNHISNLKWVSYSTNTQRNIKEGHKRTTGSSCGGTFKILTTKDIDKMFELKKTGMSNNRIAELIGCSGRSVRRYLNTNYIETRKAILEE